MPSAHERQRLEGRHEAASNAYRQIANHNAKLALGGRDATATDLQLERDALTALEQARRALLASISENGPSV